MAVNIIYMQKKLRKFHVRVDSIECNNTMYATHEIIDEQAGNCNCAIICDKDFEFGGH
jgi:hypothetical protein